MVCLMLLKVQVTFAPIPTVMLPGVFPWPVHDELLRLQPESEDSATLYPVPAVTVYVEDVPVPLRFVPVVVTLIDAGKPLPPVVVKANAVFPPTVFFTTVIVPVAVLVNVQVTV
jgi:hypothetical protein